MNKILTLIAVLFLLSASTTLAQDLCDSYHNKYRACVEAGEGGSNVDYDDCATHTNETDCTNANCFWNDQGLPAPGVCIVDVCLADMDFSGRITGADLGVFKKDLGRIDCETAPDRFTDNGNGTVTDNVTGLVWLKDANCFGLLDWYYGEIAAATLSSGGGCGLQDGSSQGEWRQPTKEEWEAFVCTEYNGPVVCNTAGTGQWTEGQPFENVQSSYYWSSTEYVSSNAWGVNMIYGNMAFQSQSFHGYVWPVRDP